MNGLLEVAIRRARLRRVAIVVALAAPLTAALVGSMLVLDHATTARIVLLACVAATAFALRRAIGAVDDAALARRLDAARPDFDDSSELLFRAPDALGAVAKLQRERLLARLDSVPDLREHWPRRALAIACIALVASISGAFAWRAFGPASRDKYAIQTVPAAPVATTLVRIDRAALEIAPPAYTGLPSHTEPTLEPKVESGARVRWRVHLDAPATALALRFHDGSRVELARDGAEWTGERVVAASALYRFEASSAPPWAEERSYRLEAIDDRPPQVRVIEPEKTLSLLEGKQKTWTLAFEASDDYAVADAKLALTLAQGTGENITVKEQTIELHGDGAPRLMRYRHAVDLAALGIAAGDDVIARLTVADNRKPQPNTTRSASFILRWPPDTGAESTGVEGVVQTALPAYFRSQRQIIIDTQALIAERPRLAPEKLLDRSDAIGVDQKVLRLRYGRFLGEESETRGAPNAEHEKEHAAEPPKGFGESADVLAEFGHTHDQAEAATLLDPETRRVLKLALEQMWQSELALRLGKPEAALPYEFKALEYVKQVQQANRIYLARVGAELPVPDPARRLSGERKGLADRVGALAPRADDALLARAWLALRDDDASVPDLRAWLDAHERDLPDALALRAALDAAATKAGRAGLRKLLWPLLPRPATRTTLRATPDAAGRVYLDALAEPAP